MTRITHDTAATNVVYADAAALARGELLQVEVDQSALAEGRLVAAALYGENRPLVVALTCPFDDKEAWDDAVEFAEFMIAQHAA